MNVLLLLILLPLITSAAIMVAGKAGAKLDDAISIFVSGLLLILSCVAYYFMGISGSRSLGLGGFNPPLGINLVLDPFSGLFLIIISFVAFMVIAFSFDYMKKFTDKASYYSLMFLLISGLYGVVLTGDLFSLYLFIELVAVSSVALVAFGCEAEELEAAFKYLIIGTIASFFILFGIAITYSITGSLNMAHIAGLLGSVKTTPVIDLAFVLMLAGFCIKAALPPFHSWLPDAHPSAPAPVSAMLSAVVVKAAGIYILCRMTFNVFGSSQVFSDAMIFLGVLAIVIGAVMAMGQWDIKRLFAYSTISQIGYIVFGIGLATPLGVLGALLHLFNHSIMKSLLFLNSGSLEYATGTRDIREMGGLKERMPITYITSLIGALSVAGVPPFGGFFSKLIIIIAAVLSGRYFSAAIAVLMGIITLSYMLRALKYVFYGELKPQSFGVSESPTMMRLPMIVLALLVVVSGLLFPWVLTNFINPAMKVLMEGSGTYSGFIIGG